MGCARCAISIFRPRGSVTQGTRLLPKPLIILKTDIVGRLSKMKQKDRQPRSNTLKMTISSDRSPWERGPFAAQGEFLELGVIRLMNNFIYCSLASFTVGISMGYGEKLSLYHCPLRAVKNMENIYLSFLASGEEVGTLSKEILSLSPAFQVRMTGPPFPKAEPTTLP